MLSYGITLLSQPTTTTDHMNDKTESSNTNDNHMTTILNNTPTIEHTNTPTRYNQDCPSTPTNQPLHTDQESPKILSQSPRSKIPDASTTTTDTNTANATHTLNKLFTLKMKQ